MQKRGSDLNRAFIYFFMYCPLGTICPLIGQYLSSIGFSGTQVGVVTSLGTCAAVLGGLFWGKLYANIVNKKAMLAVMCVFAAVFCMLSTTTTVFAVYAIIYSCMYFFQGPSHGIIDSIAVSNSNNFPILRGTGAIGYAVAAFVVGKYAEAKGLDSIFILYAITFVIAIAFIMREKNPPLEKDESEKITMAMLFQNKQFVKLLVCAFFMTGTSVANNTYFGYLFRDGGGTVAGIGLAFLLMAGGEAPMMALAPKLSKKIGTEKLILICAALMVGRFGFYAIGPSYKVLLATFFLQGITQGIILVEIVKYFDKIVEPKFSGIAISVYYALGNNFSVIVCSLIGGVILDLAGPQAVYWSFAIINAIAVALYIVLRMYKPAATPGLQEASAE